MSPAKIAATNNAAMAVNDRNVGFQRRGLDLASAALAIFRGSADWENDFNASATSAGV